MSMGYGVCGRLKTVDEHTIVYSYYSYNLNIEQSKDNKENYDGMIEIDRAFLVEPEVYTKRIKKPSGKKVIEERIRKKDVDIESLIDGKHIRIMNSGGAWKYVKGFDIMAIHLARSIFEKYQETRDIPDWVSSHA